MTEVDPSITGLLSVNQLSASIKLLEAWKAENVPNYPIKLEPNNPDLPTNERSVRPSTSRKYNQDSIFAAAKYSLSRNAARLWNTAPMDIKTLKYVSAAKNAIKKYCNTQPI